MCFKPAYGILKQKEETVNIARFRLFIWDRDGKKIPAQPLKATRNDLETTLVEPVWQTNWTTDYITKSGFAIYALKTQIGELVALDACEMGEDVLTVHIVYMESQAENNPTLSKKLKYRGIGWALIAYGIKLSVDAGFIGDVTLNAKTPELAKHYERDFGAILVLGRGNGAAPRYLICDEVARDVFTSYLEEG